jgi:hypothetical protein
MTTEIEIVDAYDDAVIVDHYGPNSKFYLHVRPSNGRECCTAVALTRAQVKELRRELKRILQETKV